jgi:long-chain fatty acid transport protein
MRVFSFRLVRNPSCFSERFPTRFTCGNDKCQTLLVTFLLFSAVLLTFFPHISFAGTPVLGSKAAGMGTAFTAVSDDPSAIAHNPAGLTQLKGSNAYGGITLFLPHSTYESLSGESESTDFLIYFPPHLYFVSDLKGKDLHVGIGIYSPFGIGGKKWDPDGPTRYSSIENLIGTIAVNPTLAYQLLPSLSVGAGVEYMYSFTSSERKINQSILGAADATSSTEADGGGWGYNVGILYKPVEIFSIGLTYRSRIRVDYDGNIQLKHIAPALQMMFGGSEFKTDMQTSLEFPDTVSLGIAYRPSEKIVIAVDIDRTMWSTFDSMNIDVKDEVTDAGFTDTSAPLQWRDIWLFKIGAEYKYSDALSLRAGYTYVQTPVPDHTLDPAFSDADMNAVSFGVGYRKGAYLFDFGYSAAFYEDRTVDNRILSGTYGNFAQFVSFSLGRSF